MSTDINLLSKGLKQLAVLILLFILSPISLTMGFKALKKFTESPQLFIGYAILLAGFLITVFTLFFAFRTFKVLRSALFKNDH
ncbi:MAG: DUF6095 family protein [Polaribacter sp.]